MIENTRIELLDDGEPERRGELVLYWVRQSQREAHNESLEFSVGEAIRRHQPVVVLLVLMETYPEANERHFTFVLQGIRETAESLEKRGTPSSLEAATSS